MVYLISRCRKIINKTTAVFHFSGSYHGNPIKKLHLSDKEQNLKVGCVYLLKIEEENRVDQVLEGKIVRHFFLSLFND